MSLLDVKYYELEKMRCLLFIAKLFPYKSLRDMLYGNPNKMFYIPNIKKFINFKYSITPYSTFTDEYQIKVSKMRISPSCLIPHYKESLKDVPTSHWSLKIPIRDFVEAGKMGNIGGILYDARHHVGLFPFNYYTSIDCGELVQSGANKLKNTIDAIQKYVFGKYEAKPGEPTINPMTSVKPEKYFVFAEAAAFFIEMIGGTCFALDYTKNTSKRMLKVVENLKDDQGETLGLRLDKHLSIVVSKYNTGDASTARPQDRRSLLAGFL
jgi:hypothetical protein